MQLQKFNNAFFFDQFQFGFKLDYKFYPVDILYSDGNIYQKSLLAKHFFDYKIKSSSKEIQEIQNEVKSEFYEYILLKQLKLQQVDTKKSQFDDYQTLIIHTMWNLIEKFQPYFNLQSGKFYFSKDKVLLFKDQTEYFDLQDNMKVKTLDKSVLYWDVSELIHISFN
jgi:hypothetical protein